MLIFFKIFQINEIDLKPIHLYNNFCRETIIKIDT